MSENLKGLEMGTFVWYHVSIFDITLNKCMWVSVVIVTEVAANTRAVFLSLI